MIAPMECWRIVKHTVRGKSGLVAAQNRRAAEAGTEVLRKGGNAVDAAIATGFALGVTEPWMSGLGGGGLMIIRPGDGNDPVMVDAAMVAPRRLDPADYPLAGGTAPSLFNWPAVEEDRNVTGAKSVCVPGVVDGYRLAWERFGTLDWAELVEPARALAAEGLLIDWYTTLNIALDAARLSRFPESAARFLPNALPAVPSSTPKPAFRDWGALPQTLEILRDQGPRAFYEGALGTRIALEMETAGSTLAADDLANYHANWVATERVSYRDTIVHTAPGLTGGPTLAKSLAEIEGRSIDGAVPGPADYLAYANALSGAFAHRLERMGASGGESCTSHLTVADGDGMMVSLTQTLLARFGSAMVLPETGILMNNGVLWFNPLPGQPNSIAPGVRPLANMSPAISIGADGAVTGYGACGGRRIIGAVLQVLSFVEDFGMDPAAALAAPRIDVSGGGEVLADMRLPSDITEALSRHHHTTTRMTSGVYPEAFAVPNLVRRAPDGDLSGAVSPYHPWADVVAA